MDEQRYFPIIKRKVRSEALYCALARLFLDMAKNNIGSMTEAEIREHLANKSGTTRVAQRFKTHYLLPVPPDPQGSAASCR
jgi:hypothetical protein